MKRWKPPQHILGALTIFDGRSGARGVLLKLCIAASLLWMFGGTAGALDWPVAKKVLTATFGENRWNHFHDGIDIGGGNQQVHPSADGEIIFRFEEGSDSRDLPTGLGSFLVLQNTSEFRTLYAHFQKGTMISDKTSVTTGDVLGIVGDTGDSLGSHLHFSVIDTKKGEYLNPLTLLPPLEDTQSPVISSVSLEQNKKSVALGSPMSIPAGKTSLLATVYDPSQYVDYYNPMAPFEIDAAVNGQQLFKITYDRLKAKDGKMYLQPSDGRTFDNYYVATWQVRLGTFELKPGDARIVVTAHDFSGNESSRSYDLTVPAAESGSGATGAGG